MKTHQPYHEPGDIVLAAWQEQVEQAQEKPWLAALLLRQGERILRRFAYFYERLRALPRNTRRTIQKKLATTLAGAALLLALSGTPSVHAASITVDGTTCTLADAITAANTNTATGGCDAGDDTGGYDTIDLQTDVTLSAALPTINSSIVLEGNGFTIDGNNSFQVLHVSGTNGLTLNNATITGGSGDVSGAGIGCTYCIMTVNNSTITGNSSNINGGGIYMNDGSRVVINNSTISGNTAYMGGGGIDVFTAYVGGELTINNSTITGNSTSDGSSGGGISATYVYNPLSVQLNRTIVSGNTSLAAIRAEIECWSDCYGNNYNIIGYGGSARSEGFTPSGTDVVPAGALSTVLDTNLADHGGPTFIHALVLGSPAIDIAPSAACSAAPVNGVDQRGMARNIDGLGDGDAGPGLECDAGAHELQSPTAVTFAGLTSSGAGKAAPAALGATGVLALLTGGWLARSRRRKV